MRIQVLATALAVGAAGVAVVQWRHGAALDAAASAQAADAATAAGRVAGSVEHTFRTIYQGLRTIARLPGVQQIERHGENFVGDARCTVQELYNLLATNVAMSEVYIVPRGLDPERIDPVTNEPEAPIVTFDELIVDRRAKDAEEKADEHGEAGPEEIEIYEYRAMREQLAWFEQHTPTASVVAGLDVPALCSREVVTCDNSRFDARRPDDRDRSGLVYSVPFFRPNGDLAGMISGVVLTHALRDLLPGGTWALIDREQSYTALSHDEGPCHGSQALVERGAADPSLPWSQVRALEITDSAGKWLLWGGIPAAAFAAREDVAAAAQMQVIGWILVVVCAGLASFAVHQLAVRRRRRDADLAAARERQRLTEEQRNALEARLQASERAQQAAATMATTAAAIASTTEQLGSSSATMSSSAITAADEAAAASSAANEVRHTVDELAKSVRQLGTSIGAIASSATTAAKVAEDAADKAESTSGSVDRLGGAVDRIQGVIELIDDVASQTNMLALNATIEAARAGDAGKGFGVVAREVKELANETAKATRKIDAEVLAIRESATAVIAAMQSIRGTIRGIRDGQVAIARSVEVQSQTSQAMDRHLVGAASLVAGIAERIGGVAGAAQQTREGVDRAREAIDGLEGMVQTLRDVGSQLVAR